MGPSLQHSGALAKASLLGLALSLPAGTAALAEDLCAKSSTWFACTLSNGKSVAVCGSPSTDPDQPRFGKDSNAWLQYRYGKPGQYELQYPTGQGDGLWRQFLGGVTLAPGGTPDRINFSFVASNTRYLIQGNRSAGKMRYFLAVLSESPVKTIAEYTCRSVDVDRLLPVALAVPCDRNDAGNKTRGQECR
jgi:hypothetical protein